MVSKQHFLPQFLRDFVQDDVVDFSEYENVDERVSLVQVCDEIQDEVLDLPPGVCESKLRRQIKVLDTHVIDKTQKIERKENKRKKVKKRPFKTDLENVKESKEEDLLDTHINNTTKRTKGDENKSGSVKKRGSTTDVKTVKESKKEDKKVLKTPVKNLKQNTKPEGNNNGKAKKRLSTTTLENEKESKKEDKKPQKAIDNKKQDKTLQKVKQNRKSIKALTSVIGKMKKDRLLAIKLKSKEKSKSFKMKIKSKLKLALPNRNLINNNKSKTWQYKNILENKYKGKMPKKQEPDVCNCPRVSPGKAGCGEDCINRMTLIECHPDFCINGADCTNTVIQKKKFAPGLQRFMTEGKGWGVRAQNTLQENQYVLEYTGEVVDEDTFEHRMKTRYKLDKHHYCMALGGGLYIDAHRTGSECRFVNHSCEPNATMVKWSVGGLSKMALFTTRKIKIGEEITYDYNFENYNSLQGQVCKCGSKSCRGIIGAKGEVKPQDLSQSVKMQPVVKLMKFSKNVPSKSNKVSKAKKMKDNPSKLDYRKIIKTKFPHRPVHSKFSGRQSNYLITK
eukprot:TRINITY_DN39983_c0_g1_i1.p1 TRINITY_DN39983_c0_g1~~TRINITY_DN39983_c0_g1_i1.p1  ORF type:complete len:563 (-),score=153.26 TRINITY_DN39983_c0_g1_i1:63-1751(-)